MIEFLRRAIRSWVAKALLGLLVLSFAVWGIEGVGSGFSTRVATVGDQVVEAEVFASVLSRERQRFGLDNTQIRPMGLDRFVLARMVREAALDDAAARLGLSAPDEAVARQVRGEAAFQVAGQFDATQYQNAVRRAFRSVGAYEETVRRSIASGLISQSAAAASAPPGAAAAMVAFREERRLFDALTLDADALGIEVAEPDDAALEAFLSERGAQFQTPERRDVAWLRVDPARLAGEIDEAELRQLYDDRRRDFVREERRAVDQIVYATLPEAQAARDRLDAGEGFDALLAEKGLSRADAALGFVEQGELPDARGPAAFALSGPGVAGPAQTATGFALMSVTEIEPADVVPFEDVREGLAAELAARLGGPEADRVAETAEDLRAGGATLEEVAQELALPFGRVEGATATGPAPDGVPEDAFLEEAFAARQGAERDLIRLGDGGYLAVRVDAVTPAATPPLADIRPAVAAAWRADRRRAALAEAAEALAARLAAGETLAALAEEHGRPVEPVGPLRRRDPDPRLGEAARARLFAAEPGAVAATAGAQSATVAVLREVLPPEGAEAVVGALAQALAGSVAQDQLEYLGRALEAEAGVAINPAVVESVLSQLGA